MTAIPTYKIDSAEVQEAWEAYEALQLSAKANPKLLENKYHKALQDTAFARFMMNFEAL